MKVAICLYGNLGNPQYASQRSGEDLMAESRNSNHFSTKSLVSLRKLFLEKYDTDIFIHSWSESEKETILSAYDPKLYVIEKQRPFDKTLEDYGMYGEDMSDWDISPSARIGYEFMFPSRKTVANLREEMTREVFRTNSRWYSTQQSIKLKEQYEKDNGFRYDLVLVTRFDNMFLRFPTLDSLPSLENFYAAPRTGREDLDLAFYDYWFLSNSENMDKFGKLYDNITDYCIRPTFSCREHVEKFIGKEKIFTFGNHNTDYVLDK
jgi:hypothetical protein